MSRTHATGRWYDGPVYATVIDRQLAGVREYVANHLPAGDPVLDACCGTGALSERIARTGRTVVGVDLSPRHIAYAKQRAVAGGVGPGRARFEVADIAQLAPPSSGRFGVAVVLLALHEMAHEARRPVLDRLLNVAQRVMIVDFAAPMPRNAAGLRNRLTEIAAGIEHFAAFRDWLNQGGVKPLVADAPVSIESDRTIDRGTLRVVTLSVRAEGD